MSLDVVIIGAGPAGSLAATLLARQGHRVLICERTHFPRFQIGESLLPQAMVWLEEAGLLPRLEAEKFQPKNGAVFRMGARQRVIDFNNKTTPGPAATWQVPRERFDLVLADGAQAAGAEIRFGCRVTAFQPGEQGITLRIEDDAGTAETIAVRFVLDASGFGRVLAGLLDLEQPSPLPPRSAVFTHVRDSIRDTRFDRQKILISIHPEIRDVWYWLIPFRDGLASIGAVGPAATIDEHGASDEERIAHLVTASGFMGEILAHREPARPTGRIDGYSRGVVRLSGPGYALLGNAAEFLDPIFSSGVTIAMKSASLAAGVLDRQLRGEPVDWQEDYETPLKIGIETFRAHVEAWYGGSLQEIILDSPTDNRKLARMITSVLAGYAWDTDNPFVRAPTRYLGMLEVINR